MIELIIKNYLDDNLDVPVFLEKTGDIKGEYVIFEKTGSSDKTSTFAFQSYSDSMYESARLNEKVKDAVKSMITLHEISKVKINSDYNFTDTRTKKYRYQAVFDIFHY